MATTEAASPQADTDRLDEIVEAVNQLLDEHETFVAGDAAFPPESFDVAVTAADIAIHSGDWPKQSIKICVKFGAFLEHWNRYRGGEWTRDYSPRPQVWSALRDLIEEFELVRNPIQRTIEPVHVLLEQMKDFPGRYRQVAKAYGWRKEVRPGQFRWTGPFFDGNEVEVTSLIEKEAKDPGSVVPVGWRPDDEIEREKRSQVENQNRLANARRRLNNAKEDVDPASIDDLLFEGQFPDVIAKVKKVEIGEVLARAEALAMKPNDRENPDPWVDPRKQSQDASNFGSTDARQKPELHATEESLPSDVVTTEVEPEDATDASATGSAGTTHPDPVAFSPDAEEKLTRRQRQKRDRGYIQQAIELNPDASAGEVSEIIKTRFGCTISTRSVAGHLANMRN